MTRLFHVSDIHFGREDRDAVRWFAETVRAEKPDAVICTGDLTTRARSAEWDAAAAWLASFGVPVTVEPGNHDIPYHLPLQRLFAPYRRYEAVERLIERPLALDGVVLAPLKTTARFQWRLDWSHGRVSHDGLPRAIATVRAKPPGAIALVLCHHPLADVGLGPSEGRTTGGEGALASLAAAGADAVLSGHVHDPFDVVHEVAGHRIRLIGAGTLSERVRTSRPSFNELIIADSRLDVIPRTLG